MLSSWHCEASRHSITQVMPSRYLKEIWLAKSIIVTIVILDREMGGMIRALKRIKRARDIIAIGHLYALGLVHSNSSSQKKENVEEKRGCLETYQVGVESRSARFNGYHGHAFYSFQVMISLSSSVR